MTRLPWALVLAALAVLPAAAAPAETLATPPPAVAPEVPVPGAPAPGALPDALPEGVPWPVREPARYVALGDSFASGPFIPNAAGAPFGCARSTANYPAVLAGWLRAESFVDVTCAGAVTAHMFTPQQVLGGENPRQLDAVTPGTTLVTLTVGGNDTGFGEILRRCGELARQDPLGAPCEAAYTSGGRDELAERVDVVGTRVAEVVAAVRARAPEAEVVVVGYLRILPDGPGCWPSMPFAVGDSAYFDSVQRKLNAALADTAAAADVLFADPYPFGWGRDACAPPAQRWVEPLLPQNPAAPVHPNAGGMRAAAAVALARYLTG